ncbi:hypothetical protein M5K25_011576 [Dendrobium thyrsiflorum]|uniref:Cellulose synthase-like protein E6 n=1 Tax=Dendrobium thyrsiflorum TaxID=117978 RepID=A0ABD0VA24_DENTH
MLLGLLLIWVYRASHVPVAGEKGRWAWMAMFAAELLFGFYWFITFSARWNPIYRYTFKDRLSLRFEDKLPGVDVFICTADPIIEPPIIAINTVLSVLAYDYPPERLSVYLSDDGGSIFTFYALLEALEFAKSWVPFCRKFNVQLLSPALFFSKSSISIHDSRFSEWTAMEKLYKDMECRIDATMKQGTILKEIKAKHEGFSEWGFKTTSKDHQAIVKIVIDGRDQIAQDTNGFALPTIVYMAREKRPKYHHNFKAGALNALLRVSEQISNGPIILTLDCDMCANNVESIRDALCFFMDEERGHEYAFVQFPQNYKNIIKHDLYATSLNIIQKVDFPRHDDQGGPVYIGSCCFHRRDCLNGRKYNELSKIEMKEKKPNISEASMGLKYGCPVEDVITGLAIQCRGWKSTHFRSKREAFLGLAPTTLSQVLIQHKRWAEGDFQIFLSKDGQRTEELRSGVEMERKEGCLFEVRRGKGRVWWWLYAASMLLGLLLIWVYRASHVPVAGEKGGWAWMAMFAAELLFGFYWFITFSARWNPIYRYTFKDRLSLRFEDKLPGVDVFICTADPIIEPPIIAINTVLSVLAYDYPPEKLSVYLSDDGGSIFTFYALLEALEFAKSWVPFCRKFNVQLLSPALFFSKSSISIHDSRFSEWTAMEKLYKDMECRIDATMKQGTILKEIKAKHEGFSEWGFKTTSKDHQAIVKILIDGRDQIAQDTNGFALPTIVYMAREKRPKYHHNFKAGALNALLRVSEQISNGPIILTLDCDMCVNNAESIRDALCFFMDEERGHEYAFVQFPQNYKNIIKHDLYGTSLNIILKVDFPGQDGQGGPVYTGSCCFHRRDCLNGRKYNELIKIEMKGKKPNISEASVSILEERAKNLATCSYEENTQWGKEMGMKYGCPVEDIITGLTIQCRGWKSAHFSPKKEAFLGLAPTTLSQVLVQHKRWAEGNFQIFLSKYCPFLYGFRRTKLGHQMGYCIYSLWAVNCIPTLIYVVIPSICLLHEISLFPSVFSFWFIPFAFVIALSYVVSLWESLFLGETLKAWWNEQRMWLYKRTTSYLFALVDTILKLIGMNDLAFAITPKVADEESSKRYEKGIMEFGSTSPMFTILSTVAMLNLFCLVGGIKEVIINGVGGLGSFFLQFLLCGSLVLINFPIFEASFFRNDKGCIPTNTMLLSVALVIVAYFISIL